jgi:hypothetical protein
MNETGNAVQLSSMAARRFLFFCDFYEGLADAYFYGFLSVAMNV